VITFDTAPTDGDEYRASYGYDDDTDASGHTHTTEVKTTWAGATWTLGETPTQGIRVYGPLPDRLWVVYSDLGVGTNMTIRLMKLNATTGAFDSWATAAITGFVGGAGEIPCVLKCMAEVTGDSAYVVTRDGTDIRYYECDGTTLTLLWTFTSTLIPRTIWIEEGRVRQWLLLSSPSAPEAGTAGVYLSEDSGATFTRKGSGHSAAFDVGYSALNALAIDEVLNRLYVSHGRLTTTGRAYSYSNNDGVTWTDVQAAGNNFPDFGPGAVSLYPYRGGDYGMVVWANGGGGSTGGYFQGATPGTFNIGVQFGLLDGDLRTANFLDSASGAEQGLLVRRSSGTTWSSTDRGLHWSVGTPMDDDSADQPPAIHQTKSWAAAPTPPLTQVNVTIDYGVTWIEITTPNYCRLAAWERGF
jgi:hypothetical protein